MIWRLRICFKALTIAWACAAMLSAATVHGSVKIVSSRDPDVRRHADYAGVVVWLEPLSASDPIMPVRAKAVMVQKGKRFTPHVLPIRVGTTVDFPNYDPIFHNAFSNFNGQIFDVGLYPPGTSRSIRFRREGVVRVFCNIHPTMSAVIVVLKSPYFATSVKSGEFTIANVPDGSYRLHVFHERATQTMLDALSRPVEVSNKSTELSPITVSESGYLLLPHKNKYGKDYPPEDQGPYSGEKP